MQHAIHLCVQCMRGVGLLPSVMMRQVMLICGIYYMSATACIRFRWYSLYFCFHSECNPSSSPTLTADLPLFQPYEKHCMNKYLYKYSCELWCCQIVFDTLYTNPERPTQGTGLTVISFKKTNVFRFFFLWFSLDGWSIFNTYCNT